MNDVSGEDVTGELTHAALRGLSAIALDAGLYYASGGAMIDERYYRSVPALVDAVERLSLALRAAEERADEAALRAIEASNPGIDMDEVRRYRSGQFGRTVTDSI